MPSAFVRGVVDVAQARMLTEVALINQRDDEALAQQALAITATKDVDSAEPPLLAAGHWLAWCSRSRAKAKVERWRWRLTVRTWLSVGPSPTPDCAAHRPDLATQRPGCPSKSAARPTAPTRDKVAIMGGSYGGYATLAGLTFTPEAFACGVDIVGPSNLFTLLQTIPPYWEAGKQQFYKRMGDPNRGGQGAADRAVATEFRRQDRAAAADWARRQRPAGERARIRPDR